jgi:predicted phosphodiesterase
MSKSKRKKRSTTQILLWLLSLFLVGSMVISLFGWAILGASEATPTPEPTWTAAPSPTATPVPTQPAVSPSLTPPVAGPELPTDTPAVTTTPSPVPSLAEATPPAGFTFAVAGDSRDNPTVYRKVLASVAASGSVFLIHTGDLVHSGTERQWKEFEQVMSGFPLPFYPVPGNHDGLRGSLDGYLSHSGATKPHDSFDYGNAHFALVDSHNGGVSAAELAWLKLDLEATRQPLKMVFLHHPAFDPDGTDHIMAYGNDDFMALVKECGAGYVFAGHIHAYAQAERDGVTYVYTGGAGAPLYREHPQAFHHYLLVSVDGENVSIQVVKV